MVLTKRFAVVLLSTASCTAGCVKWAACLLMVDAIVGGHCAGLHPSRVVITRKHRMLPCVTRMLQDIPKSAERAPSRCFYTFKADVASTCARLVGE
jgi:hypothetical protein